MADDGIGESNDHSRMGRTTSPEENEEDDEPAADDQQRFSSPDIGLGDLASQKFQRNLMGESCLGAVGGPSEACSSTSSRRDDVPFSLRHFLSGNRPDSSRPTSTSNVGGGARPKVYPGTPPPSPRLHPEITSGLPDFVQDHLVVEQVYLNSTGPLSSLALDNIPPQLPPSPDGAYSNRVDLPFDLTSRSDSHDTPLDLPPLGGGMVDVGPSKSLPDFLSDGPIRSERRHDSQPVSANNSPDREIGHALTLENSRLRRELEILKTQLSIQMTRSESLEREVNRLRNRDRTSASFDNIIEQLEENLSRMTRRAVTAENKVVRLKQENHALKSELESARISCRIRESMTSAASSSQPQSDNERLASQLRNAANTAELSLRQLLMGVENLRTLASSLDSGQTTRLEHSSSDSGDDEPGPAL